MRNVYVDRPVPVPTVQKIVEPAPYPVVVQKHVETPVYGIKGPAYESFAQSTQQKLEDYKSSS